MSMIVLYPIRLKEKAAVRTDRKVPCHGQESGPSVVSEGVLSSKVGLEVN